MKIKEIYSAPQTLFQEIEAINLVCGSGDEPVLKPTPDSGSNTDWAPTRFYV